MTVYIGIDWSQAKHDVCMLNEAGAAVAQFVMPHTAEGLLRLEQQRQALGVSPAACVVGIETAYTLVIDFLWGHAYEQVYVTPPSVIGGARSRFRSSGARTDPSDAYVIADTLRTDRGRLQPWHPDGTLTQELRRRVGLVRHLTRSITAHSNRLAAVLGRYYPGALHVFHERTSQIALQFIRRYPTPAAAARLNLDEFKAFAREQRYTHPQHLAANLARLQQAYPTAEAGTVEASQAEAVTLATLLLPLVQMKEAQLRELRRRFEQHPDAPIFDSLPGVGDLLAPALLTKLGDDRARFPDAASVQALAGTCPVTESSGKRRRVHFRWSCDREFRWLAHTWAMASLGQSTWANAYWQQARARGLSRNQAYRSLANRWLAVVWKLWQTRQPYDEAYHLQQRAARSKPRA